MPQEYLFYVLLKRKFHKNAIKICIIIVFVLMLAGNYTFIDFCMIKPLAASAADTLRPVIFGPYIALDGGEYEVIYKIRSMYRLSDQSAVLEVVSNNGSNVYATKTISDEDFKEVGAIESFRLVFKTSGDRGFEFRVKSIEGTDLDVQEIAVIKIKKWSQQEMIGNQMIRGATNDSVITQTEGSLEEGVNKKYSVGSGLYKYEPPPVSTITAKDLSVDKILRMSQKDWERVGGFLFPLVLTLIFMSGLLIVLTRVFRMKHKKIKASVVAIILSWLISSIIIRAIGSEGLEAKAGTFIAIYLIFNLILKINPRLPMGIAAFFFTFCSILMIRSDARAETMVVYAYTFLVVGVGNHIAESVLGEVFRKISIRFDSAISQAFLLLESSILRKDAMVESRDIKVAIYSRAERLKSRRRQERQKATGVIIATSIVLISGIFVFRAIERTKSLNLFVGPEQGSIKKHHEPDRNRPETKTDPEKKLCRIAVVDGTDGAIGAGIVKVLQGHGLDSVEIIEDARFDLSKTMIRCKEGRFEEAGKIAADIAGGIRIDFAADINKESDSDFIIIIGSDIVERQQVLVDVLNGNGIKGEASTIGRILIDHGLTIRSAVNADSHDNERTVIKYKPGYAMAALLVGQAISIKYPSFITEDTSIGVGVDIVLVLGLDGPTK